MPLLSAKGEKRTCNQLLFKCEWLLVEALWEQKNIHWGLLPKFIWTHPSLVLLPVCCSQRCKWVMVPVKAIWFTTPANMAVHTLFHLFRKQTWKIFKDFSQVISLSLATLIQIEIQTQSFSLPRYFSLRAMWHQKSVSAGGFHLAVIYNACWVKNTLKWKQDLQDPDQKVYRMIYF